jgi:hypothetical protein
MTVEFVSDIKNESEPILDSPKDQHDSERIEVGSKLKTFQGRRNELLATVRVIERQTCGRIDISMREVEENFESTRLASFHVCPLRSVSWNVSGPLDWDRIVAIRVGYVHSYLLLNCGSKTFLSRRFKWTAKWRLAAAIGKSQSSAGYLNHTKHNRYCRSWAERCSRLIISSFLMNRRILFSFFINKRIM